MDRTALKDRLMANREQAGQQIIYIKEHPGLDAAALHEHIYEYVLYKYNLSGEVRDVYVLNDLAELSVAKALKLSREQAVAFDNKGTCDGTTSAMNKKVLLLMAVQRELDIRFPPLETAKITTTQLLADAVRRELAAKQAEGQGGSFHAKTDDCRTRKI